MAESDMKLLIAKPKPKKPPKTQPIKNQDPKKLTTKEMINIALTEMTNRKGTSLYAIKKYLEDKFNVDVEKLNHIIKKSIKDSVEAGDIMQTKGIGASGSFKLSKEKKKTAVKEKSETEKTKKSSKEEKKIKKVTIDKKEKTVEQTKKGKKVKNDKPATIAKGLQTPKKTAMMKRKSIGSIIKKPKMKPKKA